MEAGTAPIVMPCTKAVVLASSFIETEGPLALPINAV